MNPIVRTALLSLFTALVSIATHADSYHCNGLPVEVETSHRGALDTVCSASAAALNFLSRFDLVLKEPILLEMMEEPLQTRGHPVYGSFNSRTGRLQVMSYSAITKQLVGPKMYDEPFDPDHYRGVIAHEVTHAVVQQNTSLEKISNAAQEYLAHATQLAVMPAPRRNQIIGSAGVGPWEPDDVISDIYMAFALNRFAVKCYLHLTRHGEPLRFVNTLLTYKWRYVTVM